MAQKNPPMGQGSPIGADHGSALGRTLDEVPDLRTRRRLETQAMIHRVVVELFEARGAKSTTVEQISARAGVSSRTFFRHFASKEHAALPGVSRLEVAIDALEFVGGTPSAALHAVEAMLLAVVAREPQGELRENRRLRRIIESEPEILGLVVAQDQELARRLRQRLLDIGGPEGHIDEASARLIAEVSMSIWRSGWDLWATRDGEGAADPLADHRRAWSAVRGMV